MAQWWIIVESSPSQQATNQLLNGYPPGIPVYFQGTQAQATARANETVKTGSTSNGPFGPFATKQDAEASWNSNAGNVQHAGTGGPVNVPGSPLQGLAAIGDFFQRLTQASTWVRVGEVVLGLILLGVAAARITGAQNFLSSAVKARVP